MTSAGAFNFLIGRSVRMAELLGPSLVDAWKSFQTCSGGDVACLLAPGLEKASSLFSNTGYLCWVVTAVTAA